MKWYQTCPRAEFLETMEKIVINTLKTFFTRTPSPSFTLEVVGDNWGILENGEAKFTYTRKRDAIRGAQRRNILLANV